MVACTVVQFIKSSILDPKKEQVVVLIMVLSYFLGPPVLSCYSSLPTFSFYLLFFSCFKASESPLVLTINLSYDLLVS